MDDLIILKCCICDEPFDNLSSKYLVHKVLKHATTAQRKQLALFLAAADVQSEETFCLDETYYNVLISVKRIPDTIKPELIDDEGRCSPQEPLPPTSSTGTNSAPLSEPFVEKVEPNIETIKVEVENRRDEEITVCPTPSKASHPCRLCDKVLMTKYTLAKHLKTKHNQDTIKRKKSTATVVPKKQTGLDDNGDSDDSEPFMDDYSSPVHSPSSSSPTNADQTIHTSDGTAVVTANAVYQCEFCPKTFTRLKYFESHSRRHIEWNANCRKRRETKVHLCNVCGKRYPDAYTLKMHLYVHSDERPLRCDICGKGFVIKPTLRQHMYIHSGEKPYVCDVEGCGRAFTHATGKRQHYNSVHSDIKRFECEHCQKPFARKTHLLEHVRNHTGERPYGCEFCGMFFKLTSTLRAHRKTHTGDRPFKCKLCNKGFIKSHNLKAHMAAKRSCVPVPAVAVDRSTALEAFTVEPVSSVTPLVPLPAFYRQ